MRDIKEAIEYSIEKEEQAAAFYTQISKIVSSAGSRKVLEELAVMERQHQTMLEELDISKLPEHTRHLTPDLKISDYMQAVTFTPDMDYQAILIMAMKAEQESHEMYLDMATQYKDTPELHKLFDFMAEQEARHKLAIETQYDDLVLKED